MTSGGTHPGPRIQNYGTPWPIVIGAEEDEKRGRFELDVCAEEWSSKADRHIALPMNGLRMPWSPWNWCNPEFQDQAQWMQRAAWWSERHRFSTALLARVSTDSTYWFRLVTLRATCDFYVGRIAFIAPPGGVTLKQGNETRFIPGGEPVKGTSFASALVLYGPGYIPGLVRWRDAESGRLIDVKRARELREQELLQ